jgi:hypothetical protein
VHRPVPWCSVPRGTAGRLACAACWTPRRGVFPPSGLQLGTFRRPRGGKTVADRRSEVPQPGPLNRAGRRRHSGGSGFAQQAHRCRSGDWRRERRARTGDPAAGPARHCRGRRRFSERGHGNAPRPSVACTASISRADPPCATEWHPFPAVVMAEGSPMKPTNPATTHRGLCAAPLEAPGASSGAAAVGGVRPRHRRPFGAPPVARPEERSGAGWARLSPPAGRVAWPPPRSRRRRLAPA